MQRLVIIFYFLIFCCCDIFSQVPNYNINSGTADYTGDSIKVNYVIGEVLHSISNENILFFTLPLAVLIDSINGIYLLNKLEIRMYPNPVYEKIYISLSEHNSYSINLTNEIGQFIGELFNGYLLSDEQIVLDISKYNLVSGNYYLQIKTLFGYNYINFIYIGN